MAVYRYFSQPCEEGYRSSFWVCDTEGEKPSGSRPGDQAYTRDAGGFYLWDGSWTAVGGGGSIPTGIIVMWSGLLSAIPSGWLLCDGTSGTPDLRDRFVKGTAAGVDPGATGGAATHSHAYTEIVQHTHAVNVTDNGHTHLTQRYPTATGGSSGFTIDTSMSGTLADNTLPTKSATTGITATTSNPGGSVASGTTATASSEPDFYAIAYIMKS
jgi:microcystin-dependent protein